LRVITAQAMRAILFASATVTSLTGRRPRIFLSQVPTVLFHPSARWTIDVAPSTGSLRISRLPVLVIRPRRVFPPVEFYPGTRPSQAANCRAVLNREISPTVAAISDAVIGPIPGDRRQTACGLIVAGVRDDLRFESLNAFGQFLTMVVQPGDRPTGLLCNGLVRVNEFHEFRELSNAFRHGQTEFGCQAAHGIRQHRLLFDQQGSSRMQGQDVGAGPNP
jgi:hypothetical protein